jgi:hypothetical protein
MEVDVQVLIGGSFSTPLIYLSEGRGRIEGADWIVEVQSSATLTTD